MSEDSGLVNLPPEEFETVVMAGPDTLKDRVDGLDNTNITVTSTSTIGSLVVADEIPEPRNRNIMQSVEFSPTLTKASFRHSRCSDTSDDGPIRNISKRMLILYLQHLGNAIYLMFIMALGFVYPLVNALSYGKTEYEKTKEQFEIFMIIVHGISIVILTVIVVRLTLRKSDEDRGHGEGLNFFLRIGAIVFCIGVIILNILRALEPVEFLLMFNCEVTVKPTHITFYALSVIFYALQTYFMFKYHKTSFLSGPNKQEKHYIVQFWIIRLTLIHLIGVNLIHWLNSIMWEAVELFEEANHQFKNHSIDSTVHANNTCSKSATKILSSKAAQPYLFPCVIEYSLIAAGALLAMYMRVGAVEKERIFRKFYTSMNNPPSVFVSLAEMDQATDTENITVQTQNLNEVFPPPNLLKDCEKELHLRPRTRKDSDAMSTTTATTAAINRAMGKHVACKRHPRVCEKSHVGFFAGLMFLAGSIVYIACEFIFKNKIRNILTLHITFNAIWSAHYVLGICLTVYLIIRLTVTFRFEFRLSVEMEKMLLYVTYFGNLIFLVACTTADVDNASTGKYHTEVVRALYIFGNVTQIIQEALQAVFIFYGLNMRAVSCKQRKAKPGRTALTISIFLNMIVWLRESLLLKKFIITLQYVHFYGLLPWCMISSTCFPLIIFFRFHSASLLAEIWSRAYD